jgi:predicted CopG family antitoxin
VYVGAQTDSEIDAVHSPPSYISEYTSKCTSIVIKSLTITDEAYERLKKHKREEESFTDAILRLTGSERDLMKGFGAMSDVDGFREAVETTRDELDADLRERSER